MIPPIGMWYIRIIILLIIIQLFYVRESRAEDEQRWILSGYGSIPTQMIGISVYGINTLKIGYYGTLAITVNQPYYDDPNLYNMSINKAENIFGDTLLESNDKWQSFFVGITQKIYKLNFIYGGIGFSNKDVFRKYDDEYEILGNQGHYWIKDSDASIRYAPGIQLGLLHIMPTGWCIGGGFQTTPQGVHIIVGKKMTGP